MPVKDYFLNSDKREKIEIEWKRNFSNCTVRFNNKEIIRINSKKEFREGKEFRIDYKTLLRVQLKKIMLFFTVIDLTLNKKPVPGSMNDPVKQINEVYGLVLFIAILNLLLGAVSILFSTEWLLNLGIGWYTLFYGGIFLILGFMIKRYSQLAMLLAIILMSLDIISVFILAFKGSSPVSPGSIILVKGMFLLYMLRGIPAIKRIKMLQEMEEQQQREREEKKQETPRSQRVTEDHTKFMPRDHSGYIPDE